MGQRLVELLLLLYPPDFRDEYRQEIRAFLRQERRLPRYSMPVLGAGRFWLTVLPDLVRGGIRAHRRRPDTLPAVRTLSPHERGLRIDAWGRDLRHGLRAIVASPVGSLVIVVTLALGVGMNTAVFSIFNAVLLRSLPYEDPASLVYVQVDRPGDEIDDAGVPAPFFRAVAEGAESLEELAALTYVRQNLTGIAVPRQVQIGWTSPSLPETLGMTLVHGRTYGPEDHPGSAVLSHSLWRESFAADPDVVGTSITLDGKPHTVVGIAAPDFRLPLPGMPRRVDVWKNPDSYWSVGDAWNRDSVSYGIFRMIGRLGPGETMQSAEQEVRALLEARAELHPDWSRIRLRPDVMPLRERIVGSVRGSLLLLLGAVGAVMAVACANVMNLMLVRADRRRIELTVRAALGARRTGLVRLLLAESLLLALAGGAAGIGLAVLGIRMLESLPAGQLPRIGSIGLDPTVLTFALLISLLATLAFGLIPALRAARPGMAARLRTVRSSGDKAHRRLSASLVVGQIALSLVLLIGAGLLAGSLLRLSTVDPGFRTEDLLTFSISLPGTRYENPGETGRFFERFVSRMEALPEVTSAAALWPLPLSGSTWTGDVRDMGQEEGAARIAQFRLVTPGLFETLDAPILEGRTFGPEDRRTVAVVDRVLAERLWPGQPAVGRQLLAAPWGPPELPFEVVGVVESMRTSDLRQEPRPTIYFDSRNWSWVDWEVDFVVRARTGTEALVGSVRDALGEMDSEIPVAEVRSMVAYVDDQLASNRFTMTLVGVFAGVAGVLALVGLYGVLSYAVGQRRRELAIRMAVGSNAGEVLRLVLGDGLRLTLVGLALGIGAALLLSRFLSGFLYGVRPTEPWIFAAVSVVFVAVAALASYLPGHRATRVEPVQILRSE